MNMLRRILTGWLRSEIVVSEERTVIVWLTDDQVVDARLPYPGAKRYLLYPKPEGRVQGGRTRSDTHP